MERMTVVFWTVICLLLGASVYFGLSAEAYRREIHQASQTSLASGDIVRLVKVIDGDSLLAAKEGEEPVSIRLLGVKAFESKLSKDAVSTYSQACVDSLRHHLENKPLRVLLNADNPKDKQERYLATLYADDQDVAVSLIREGLILVYTVYPFAALQSYHQEQEAARLAKRGLWANRQARTQAEALIRDWRSRSEN